MKLFYNTYESNHAKRNAELKFCRQKNKEMFGKYFVEFFEKKTYAEIFNFIFENSDENEVCILCNSDIFFNETIYKASEILTNDFAVITRHNYSPSKEIALEINPMGSHDVWIFRATEENKKRISKMNLNFKQGIPRCEQRLAYEFINQKFNVINLCNQIIAYHYHDSGIRNYNPRNIKETVPPPYYFINDKIYYR